MYTACKYMKVDSGLLVVFETGISPGSVLSLDIDRIENDPYLKIGREHYIRLDNAVIDCLKKCKRLHIAVSGPFESLISLQGTIEIDDVSIGKLLAYIEIGMPHNP